MQLYLRISMCIDLDIFLMCPLGFIFAVFAAAVDRQFVYFLLAIIYMLRILPALNVWNSYSQIIRNFYDRSLHSGKGKDPIIEMLKYADDIDKNDFDVKNFR